MSQTIKTKWMIIVAAAFLITGMLLAITVDAYAKNNKYESIKQSFQTLERVQKEIIHEAHIRRAITEDPETKMEKVTRVTATVSTEERKTVLESPEFEGFPEEEPVDAVFFNEEGVSAAQETQQESRNTPSATDAYYSAGDLRFMGEVYAGDWRWTWYSQNVLPGGGLNIPGRHVDENGYVCDENGRICLASSDLAYGTVVSTPFGKEGCVYDSGCDSGTLDVYVDF